MSYVRNLSATVLLFRSLFEIDILTCTRLFVTYMDILMLPL